jgi:hypothetical protein
VELQRYLIVVTVPGSPFDDTFVFYPVYVENKGRPTKFDTLTVKHGRQKFAVTVFREATPNLLSKAIQGYVLAKHPKPYKEPTNVDQNADGGERRPV